mgnify:CR=1 FL=1
MKQSGHKRMAVCLTILVMTLAYTSGFCVPNVFATGSIYISPAAIDDQSIAPGATFRVNASAANVVDVFTWENTEQEAKV